MQLVAAFSRADHDYDYDSDDEATRKKAAPFRERPFFLSRESADKPGSVEDGHSSGTGVTARLKQPTREPVRATRARRTRMLPYLALLRVGFTLPHAVASGAVRSYRTFSPLPVPLRAIGGLFSAALSVGSRPPGVTWHPALWSPDFPLWPKPQRPPGQLRRH